MRLLRITTLIFLAAFTATASADDLPAIIEYVATNREPSAVASIPWKRYEGDLRRLPTVLVENHSLKPYRQRVLGTYVLLEATLKALASDGKALKAAIASDRALRPAKVNANWKTREQPVGSLDFLTIEATQAPSPVSGGQTTRWTGRPGQAVTIPVTHVERSWAGLRTFAPDKTPVAGFDRAAEGFFWLAGQGGYGIQTAPGLSRLAGALIRQAAPAGELEAIVPALSPNRFRTPRPE